MPLVTLTTDFGTRDSYVAQMKAELLRRGPVDIRLLDLSHELPPQDIEAAAFFLRYGVDRFPAGSIHLAVIDPGVGGARRALALRAGEQLLVGPDNGIFGWLRAAVTEVVELDPVRLDLEAITPTFHGRDLFAPAAAALAQGRALLEIGSPTAAIEPRWSEPSLEGGVVRGEVVHVDRFGNLISNIPRTLLADRAVVAVQLAEHALAAPCHTYADADEGAPLCLLGSEDLLEVAVRNGSAAAHFALGTGAPITVR
ncbi:MAG: SAM-dependent chlorinase/fluorinase [Myxococcales bacterium]|nr:SAM-dependent chlorinase/fluorinase [Myxococcales bacterium]